jgi:nucleoid-associated protein YgaU
MEPAMAICAAIAALTLFLGMAGVVARAASSLRTVQIPLPTRSVATVLSAVTLLAVLVRARPAPASVAPPIIRLAGDPDPSPVPETGTPDVSVPEPSPADVATEPAVSADPTVYVVRAGDCLWRIAGRVLTERGDPHPSNAEIARFWPAIYAANRETIGDDPNLIFPGQRLTIPER